MSRALLIAVIVALLALSSLGNSSCDTSTQVDKALHKLHKAKHDNPALRAGSLSHCQKVTGAYMFRVEKLPFTAAYRRGIDGACKAADPSTNVAAVASVAQSIAKGETP